jgi:hypothetical protein
MVCNSDQDENLLAVNTKFKPPRGDITSRQLGRIRQKDGFRFRLREDITEAEWTAKQESILHILKDRGGSAYGRTAMMSALQNNGVLISQ